MDIFLWANIDVAGSRIVPSRLTRNLNAEPHLSAGLSGTIMTSSEP